MSPSINKPLGRSKKSWVIKITNSNSTDNKVPAENSTPTICPLSLLYVNQNFQKVNIFQSNSDETKGRKLRSSLSIRAKSACRKTKSKVILPSGGANDKRGKKLQAPKKKSYLTLDTNCSQSTQTEKIITPAVKNTNSEDNPDIFSQYTAEMAAEIFQFNAKDPLGFKVRPLPLRSYTHIPVPEATELVGDEEGIEDVVLVSPEELNAAIAEMESESNLYKTAKPQVKDTTKRKNTDLMESTRVFGDPYAKSVISSGSSVKWEKDRLAGTRSHVSPRKKLKEVPYRVPGPGGSIFVIQPTFAEELEIEIETVPVPDER